MSLNGRLGTNQAPGPSAGLPHGQAASSAGERVFRTADPLIETRIALLHLCVGDALYVC
jgi:hypothetical protein